MSLRSATRLVAAAALLAGSPGTATAQTIRFDGLPGGVQPPYTGHTEAGFVVTPIGSWQVGNAFGNPVPSIFARQSNGPVANAIVISREGGGLFNFLSVDLSSNQAPGTTYQFIGRADIVHSFFSQVGVLDDPNPFTFNTIFNDRPDTPIEFLTIWMTHGPNVDTYNLDNVVLRAVGAPFVTPEPGAVALLGTGLALVAGATVRRRRRGG
jgi:hypothetical protein